MFDYTQTLWLPECSMEQAVHLFFTYPEVLNILYGPHGWQTHGWKDSKLKIHYRYPLEYVPNSLHSLFQGTHIEGIFKAKKIKDSPDHVLIKSKVKLKLLIPSFIKIRSSNEFQKKENGIQMTFRCTVQIYLPNPLNKICHQFTDQMIHEQYTKIITLLQTQGVNTLV